MAKKQTRARRKKKEPEVDLSDLSRAGEHFIKSAVEFVVGAGFAVKGTTDLLSSEDGREFLRSFPSKAREKGFEFLKEATEHLKEMEKSKSKRSGRSRSRKIEVE